VDHVEVFKTAPELSKDERPERRKVRVFRLSMPERTRNGRNQPSRGLRITGREERHVVSASDELFGKRGDDALGAAIPRRGHTLQGRGELSNPQPFWDGEGFGHECTPPLIRRSRSG
jgi:hypothetical protein